MKITQITHKYQPSIGGVENYAARLNDSLRERGHTASTITTTASFTDNRHHTTEQKAVTYCETDASFYRNPFSIDLYNQVKNSTSDVYHLHGLRFLPTLEAVHALPDKKPTVLTIHGVKGPHNTLLDQVVHTAYMPFAQYILDTVDCVIVLGDDEKQWLTKQFDIPAANVSVIPNGIHPERYEVPDSAVETFRTKYGIDRSTPTVLSVTRLVPLKRPDTLTKAVSAHLSNIEMDVVIVGTGDSAYIERLRKYADERVLFLSDLSFGDLKAAYHAADVYVCTSTFEGLPTVILEAMNAKLPVVSTPVGAIPEAIQEPKNGLFVSSPPEARAVATTLRYYLDQPAVRRVVGRRNRKRIRGAFDWDDIAESIINVYDTVSR